LSTHPSPELLALYTTADLPWLDRYRVRRHLAGCDHCDRQLSLFRAATLEFKRQARSEALTGFEAVADWSRLEREMEGNITVGLDAARCIQKNRASRGLFIKLAFGSGLTLLFVLGWMTRVPAEQSTQILSVIRSAFSGNRQHEYQGPILRSMPEGIVVGSQEGSLTILHPASAVVSVSGTSAVEARYVDEETGQVTITDVYGQ
jgi:hypothetical protein